MNTEPDDKPLSSAPSEKKPDLRLSSHRDLGVEVTRDLTESGRLARGDRSNMSRLSFSSRGTPRTDLDPELQALRDPPGPPVSSKERREIAEREAAAAAAVSSANATATPDTKMEEPAEVESPGLFSKLARFFGNG